MVAKRRVFRARNDEVLVPQSVRLSAVRTIVRAIANSPADATNSIVELGAAVGFSSRKAGYAVTAARCLQLLDHDLAPTKRGRALLELSPDSFAEATLLRQLVRESPYLQPYAAGLFERPAPDPQQLARAIQAHSGFSLATCRDRAATLLSWRKQVLARLEGQKTLFESVLEAAPAGAAAHDAAKPEPEPKPRRKPRRPSKPASKRKPEAAAPSQIAMRPIAAALRAPDSLPKLVLPKRFEILEDEARARSVDVTQIVEKVESAAARIELLLRRVRDGGTGQFEVFYGETGTGKTTFLRTLPKFFHGVTITRISDEVALAEIPEFIRKRQAVRSKAMAIYIVDNRDNAKLLRDEAEEFCERLRVLFREPAGRVLVVWPVTRQATRDLLAQVAWATGGESVVSVDSRGAYEFQGLPKSRYYDVANLTVENLTGETLETFGVTRAETEDILIDSSTIGTFFALLEEYASATRERTWEILREKVKPKVWILVSGDDERYLEGTLARLSQGTKARIDIERILTHLDDPQKQANYLTEWRNRRKDVAFILRTLDVRILPVPPNVALAAVRGFGTAKIQGPLLKKTDRKDNCCETLMKSRLYKSILEDLGAAPQPHISGKPHGKKVADEYNRVQRTASITDKPLNRALGKALEYALRKDGFNHSVVIEKRSLPGTTLQPDIQIIKDNGEIICLEPTWRASGKGVEGELEPRQNSMKPGNVQMYVLDKVHEYVKALGL